MLELVLNSTPGVHSGPGFYFRLLPYFNLRESIHYLALTMVICIRMPPPHIFKSLSHWGVALFKRISELGDVALLSLDLGFEISRAHARLSPTLSACGSRCSSQLLMFIPLS